MSKKEKTIKEYLINGDNYYPNTQAKRTSSLPPGAYECKVTLEGAPYFAPMEIVTDSIIDIKNSFTDELVNEVRTFWSNGVQEKFKQYGLVHKRGVLLSGKPGVGKTIALARVAEEVITKFEGIVLFNPEPAYLKDYARLIKEIEPDKKILIMWEEFDSILGSNESELLSLLDGETQISNVIYLATTNYISRIPARIKNRPSRFARVIEVNLPSEEERRQFLKAKLHESDIDLLEPMVHASEGFVMDQIKDMIISVCCFSYPISDAVLKINEMNDSHEYGIDDYNEEQTTSVFQQKIKDRGRSGKRGPLNPLR